MSDLPVQYKKKWDHGILGISDAVRELIPIMEELTTDDSHSTKIEVDDYLVIVKKRIKCFTWNNREF